MAGVSTPDRYAHEVRYKLVEAGSKDAVVVCLSQSLVFDPWLVKVVTRDRKESDEKNGGNPEAEDGDWLGDTERYSSSHVQQQRSVSDQGEH